MADKRFVTTVSELIESTLAFFDRPEYWREAVSSAPKFFTHYLEDGVHSWGLSKVCAFKGISVKEYVSSSRYTTNGTKTRKHIAKIVGREWSLLSEHPTDVQTAFIDWIHGFFPSYKVTNARILSLRSSGKGTNQSDIQSRPVSPEQLIQKLKRQIEVGDVGELVAIQSEMERLRAAGVSEPEKYINHIAKHNSRAGFDILSFAPKEPERCIEVKSSVVDNGEFFITRNEVETLKLILPLFFGQ